MIVFDPECSIAVVQMVYKVYLIIKDCVKYKGHYCGIRHSFVPIPTMGSQKCQVNNTATYC